MPEGDIPEAPALRNFFSMKNLFFHSVPALRIILVLLAFIPRVVCPAWGNAAERPDACCAMEERCHRSAPEAPDAPADMAAEHEDDAQPGDANHEGTTAGHDCGCCLAFTPAVYAPSAQEALPPDAPHSPLRTLAVPSPAAVPIDHPPC